MPLTPRQKLQNFGLTYYISCPPVLLADRKTDFSLFQICPTNASPNSPTKHQPMAVTYNSFFRENDDQEEFLYDPELIKKLDFTQAECKFNPQVSAANPGEGLAVRPLSSKDYERGFLDILGQLTSVGNITKEQFLSKINFRFACIFPHYK